MEECEICGKPAATIYIIEIEGAQMSVCNSCAKGKKVLQVQEERKKNEVEKKNSTVSEDSTEELYDNYGEMIRKKREELGLPLKVLAERINEKESTMKRVEEQKTLLPPELMKRIEKELGIKLTHKVERVRSHGTGKGSEITIGEAAFKKEEQKRDE